MRNTASILFSIPLAAMLFINLPAENIPRAMPSRNIAIEYTTLHDDIEVIEEPCVMLANKDFKLICQVVAAEARGECYEGKLAVAQVIKDRMEHEDTKSYGGPTAEGVLLKPGQFAKPWCGNLGDYPDIAKAVIAVFVDNHRVFEQKVVFFFQPQLSSRGAVSNLRRYEYAGKVGAHEFRGDVYGQ